jgi:hypothetical protein
LGIKTRPRGRRRRLLVGRPNLLRAVNPIPVPRHP